MSRKRVAEEDLLNYRQLADEHARVLREKYDELDRKNAPPTEPKHKKGVLLISKPEAPAAFVDALKDRGVSVVVCDIDGYRETVKPDRTPAWERPLLQAQAGWLMLKQSCDSAYVAGIGNAVAAAALIAEQYPAEGLFIVGGGPRTRKPFGAGAKLAKLARQNLFSVVCPILGLLCEDAGEFSAPSISLFRTETRSDDVSLSKLRANKLSDIWSESMSEISGALYGFLGV